MTDASFSVTMRFERLNLENLGVSGEDEEAVAHAARRYANETGYGSMCGPWRDAFRRDETIIDDLEIHEPQYQTFNVTLRPVLTGRLTVNGQSSVAEAQERLTVAIQESWNMVPSDAEGMAEDTVAVEMYHYASHDAEDDFDGTLVDV